MSELDQLKLRKKVEREYRKLQLLKSKMREVEHRYTKLKKEYESLDRQQAMVDGRYKVLPPHAPATEAPRKPKKDKSLEQVVKKLQDLSPEKAEELIYRAMGR